MRHAEPQSRDRNAAAVENLQAVDESFAFGAQAIIGRHFAIGENNFGRVAGAQAELIFFFAGAKTGDAFFEDERGDAVREFFDLSVTAMATQKSA